MSDVVTAPPPSNAAAGPTFTPQFTNFLLSQAGVGGTQSTGSAGQAGSTQSAAAVAQAGATSSARNTITLPDLRSTSAFVGKAAPIGFTIPGAAGPPSVYAFGNLNTLTPGTQNAGNPGIFVGIPLSERGVTAATISSVLSTTIGGGATTDALAGALLTRYRALQQTLDSPEFRASLPRGAKVVPQVVMTIPSHDVAGLAINGPDGAQGAQVGIGMTIVVPGQKSRLGDGAAIFVNNRISVSEAMAAVERGEEPPVSRTLNFGVIALNVPVPRTNQTVNLGAGTSIRTDVRDPNAPWEVRLQDGTTAELPGAVGLIMNGLTGARSPVNLQATDFSRLAEGLGIDPSTISRAVEIGGQVGQAVDVGFQVAGAVAAFKSSPIVGILAGAGLVLQGSEAAHRAMDRADAEGMVARGEHLPGTSLLRTAREVASTDEAVWRAYRYARAVDVAVETGAADPQRLRTAWLEAANTRWSATGDPTDARVAMMANLVLGNTSEAGRIARAIGDPIPDYAGEGLASALRDVPSRRLAEFAGSPQTTRIGQGYVGVPGVGQLELRYDTRTGAYSAHGANGAQYALPGVTTLQEARDRVRELIRNGGASADNLVPLQTATGTMPAGQPTRIGQGYAGVPGVGQLEVRYDARTGAYSAHGANGAQYALPGASTRQEAMERAREMILHGGVSHANLLPLAGGTSALPTDQATRVGQGYAGVPGIGQLEVRYDTRTGAYSAHGANGAQYALPGASTRQEAMERAREMILHGGVSQGNLLPLAGGTGGLPTDQAARVGQGFAGVPGIGQLEVRYDTRTGAYSAHGPNGAQYALPDVSTRQEAMERVRELLRNGAVGPQNRFPL